ncbi:MAG: diacylglycerol/lipid kinase family protein [Jatrophihabitantaceae bacterium]
MRVLVVANPRATSTTARQRDLLVHALASDAKLEVEETANRGHAAALACRAMRDRVDVVVALGGDGTVNEVVNGLLTDGVHPDLPALGVVPGGSTNVFARALGLPNDPFEATSMLIDAMGTRRTQRINLGLADGRYFLFTAGIGYDAAVVAAVEAHRRRGKASTHRLYVQTAVSTYFRQDHRHPRLRLELPGGGVIEGLHMALVTNCDPWTYLGNTPISPTPQASFTTGLDVYARTRMGAVGLLLAVTGMLKRVKPAGEPSERPASQGVKRITGPFRRPHRSPDSTVKFGARLEHDLDSFVLSSSRPMPFQVDGDALDYRDRVEFSSIPQAIEVLI